ncbi:MAG TPA: TIGR03013 family XrtA/PEP-CTERM system glycosyltransferase [Acidobacteriaceae bacterium]|nr:TIGR03013 family XrtA/PEP-CTERM system glycosyltransferase [Acidobacteriaceae bacterium]
MIRFLNVYYPTRTVMLLLCEACIVAGCFLAASWIMLRDQTLFVLQLQGGFLKIGIITVISLILSYYFDLYEPTIVSGRLQIYFRILLVLGFDCLLLSGALLIDPEAAIAPYVYVLAFALLAPSLILMRRGYEWIVGRKVFRERIYVLGAGDYARSIVETIRSRSDLGMEIVDWQDVQMESSERKKVWIEALEKIGRAKLPVHRIIVAMESRRGELPVQELLTLRFQGIAVEEDGTLRERLYGKIQLDGLRPSNFLYSEGFRIHASQQFARQMVSIIAAATGLLLFLPFFPFLALAVKLSSKGPLFFRQQRVGMGGRIFDVIKFRTMFTDAEADGAKWATKNDPRVTKIGMLLRKTRIDEIPQLWNVLRGDMGFVGPRPERPEFVNWLTEELPFYYLRTLIRPGLTGWAQVRYGYGATLAETKEKLEYDLYYIKHMTLGLDLLIMFETVKTILRRRGAQ